MVIDIIFYSFQLRYCKINHKTAQSANRLFQIPKNPVIFAYFSDYRRRVMGAGWEPGLIGLLNKALVST